MALGRRRRDGAKEAQWREVLAKFVSSGLSVRAFCAHQRVSEPSFYAWRRDLALRDREQLASGTRSPPPWESTKSPRAPLAARRRSVIAPMPFLPVKLTAEPTASSAAGIEVTFPTGVLLRVPSSCDAAALHAVLTALHSSLPEPASC